MDSQIIAFLETSDGNLHSLRKQTSRLGVPRKGPNPLRLCELNKQNLKCYAFVCLTLHISSYLSEIHCQKNLMCATYTCLGLYDQVPLCPCVSKTLGGSHQCQTLKPAWHVWHPAMCACQFGRTGETMWGAFRWQHAFHIFAPKCNAKSVRCHNATQKTSSRLGAQAWQRSSSKRLWKPSTVLYCIVLYCSIFNASRSLAIVMSAIPWSLPFFHFSF